MFEPRLVELKLDAPSSDLSAYAAAAVRPAAGAGRDAGPEPDAGEPTSTRPPAPPADATSEPVASTAPDDGPATEATDLPDAGATADHPFRCPNCGTTAGLDAVASDGIITCRQCGGEFFAAAEPTAEDRAAAERLAADAADRAQRLSDIHMRRIVVERRYQFRMRTYHVLAMVAALVMVYHLVVGAVNDARHGLVLWPIGYAVVSGLLLAFAYTRWRRVRALTAELAAPLPHEKSLADPATPPDFSTLSDGTQNQSWKKLEQMQGE